jgi:adenylosuccinate synthase
VTEAKFNTDRFFAGGRLSVVMDGQAGSSGKGKIASFLCKHSDRWQFACNAFSAQAGHWVRDEVDGVRWERFYQSLNSCAYLKGRYQKLYIGPGAVLEEAALLREIRENDIPWSKIGISPLAVVIQDRDSAYERGECTLEGTFASTSAQVDRHDGTMKTGSTCHGVGAAGARRMLRRQDTLLARDVEALKPFLCDVPNEIMNRLDSGQAGILELAQGFQLSLMGSFYPHVTSRNVTVAQAFADMMLPPRYLGHVLLNFRTYPIRINSNKFIDSKTGTHLTWAQVCERGDIGPGRDQDAEGLRERGIEILRGDSGHWYPDQTEIDWTTVTHSSKSPTQVMELTSVTKLPRRVATFSHMNLKEAIRHNAPGMGFNTFLSVNFLNYVDHAMTGLRGVEAIQELTPRAMMWLAAYVEPALKPTVRLWLLGTGALTDDIIDINPKGG